ncbi:E3 ubiquitin-protein ligase TRIM71-like [Argopecten irradians]|uniref:E3 ubiquitin-protein ligase TRIM71-like n=1 Tax=Argopecten irradians TaxID=31199 RepID=UPI0037183D19
MATSIYEGQIPQRPQGQSTCIHHKGRQLDLYCKTCEVPACIKCMSSTHAGHLLWELNQLTSEKKQDIRSFISKTENVDLVEIDEFINSVDNSLKENINCFEQLSEQLNTQTAKLKGELDLLVVHTLSLYQQMEEDNAKLLHTYKQDLEMYSEQLKQKVEECKELLQLGTDIQIYDKDFDENSSVSLPVTPTLAIASFTPNSDPQRYLEQALGEMETLYGCQSHGRPGGDLTVRSHGKDGPPARRQTSDIDRGTDGTEEEICNQGYNLLPQTKILKKWRSPCLISSICPTTDGRAWTCFIYSNTLPLLDRKGKVVEKVKHDTMISDISLSPTKNTLWACDKCNILELESGRLQTRFSTNAEPLSICITASEHVIIGMHNKISKFTTSGELVQTTAETEEQFVTRPCRMSECPVTHNIAVVNHRREVVIMDNDLQKLLVYTGGIPDVFTPTKRDRSFKPLDVVYDGMGNLVIGDYNNQCLLLISGRGQFIRIIHTDDYWSQALGIGTHGVLWSVFRSDNVKLLQYNDMYKEDDDEYKEAKKCVLS